MLHGFADAERDTGEIGQDKTPGPEGNRDGKFFHDQINHFLMLVVRLAKVEGTEAHQPGAKLRIQRLVKTVKFLKILDLLLLDLGPHTLIDVYGSTRSPSFASPLARAQLGNHTLNGTAWHQLQHRECDQDNPEQ